MQKTRMTNRPITRPLLNEGDYLKKSYGSDNESKTPETNHTRAGNTAVIQHTLQISPSDGNTEHQSNINQYGFNMKSCLLSEQTTCFMWSMLFASAVMLGLGVCCAVHFTKEKDTNQTHHDEQNHTQNNNTSDQFNYGPAITFFSFYTAVPVTFFLIKMYLYLKTSNTCMKKNKDKNNIDTLKQPNESCNIVISNQG